MAKIDGKKISDNVKKLSGTTANKVSDISSSVVKATSEIVDSTSKHISSAIEEKKTTEMRRRQDETDIALIKIEGTVAEKVLNLLGDSPLQLTQKRMNQIKRVFPIPREQCVLWADAEFDLRPSGIVATEKGIYIRTNVGLLDEKIKFNKESECNGKAMLYYYSWNDFNATWFISDEESNRALSVERQCSCKFIRACKELVATEADSLGKTFIQYENDLETTKGSISNAAIIAGAAALTAESGVFVESKAAINNPAGHGEMAEEAITMIDKLKGIDAKVIGRDNSKDGADRIVDGFLVQTKYYKSARGSLEASFNSKTGDYRYIKDGKPMQLEVPKDQYQRVLAGFKKKIENNKVPGVSDPKEAEQIVREGRLTYDQAVNLTKPGTIESLKYDALTGAVICSCALGITFVSTMFITWRKTGDMQKSIQVGAYAGIQVFGISFLQHIVLSQVARTGHANSLMAPSQYIVGKLGYQTSATIVNGLRALSGKSAISGAAATKQLAKIMRSNVITSAITLAIFSVPETYGLTCKKISGAQYTKNMITLTASVSGGVGGAVAAGIVTSKVAGTAGTAVLPGVGTVVGIAGGFVGGAVGAKTAEALGDIIHEGDAEIFGRMFNTFVSCMVIEYLFESEEVDKLIKKFDKINPKEFKKLLEDTQKATEQETVIRKFLSPFFDEIISERKYFALPSDEEMLTALLAIEGCDDC